MKHSARTYEAIIADLARSREEWKKRGYDLSPTRVGTYEREMRRLVELGPEGRLTLSSKESGKAILLGSEISELLFASDIALTREHLASSPRIREIFSGPDFANDEKNASNRPRNTLFELTLAACIERAGMHAEFGKLTDVRTVFENRDVFIEAKRPQSFEKADSNVRYAVKQLSARSSDEQALRIVAVCAGKMLTRGTHMLTAKTNAAMSARLDKEATGFFSATSRHWTTKKHVDGLLVRVSVPGAIDGEYRHFHAALMTIFSRPGLSPNKANSLRNFVHALESSLPGSSVGK